MKKFLIALLIFLAGCFNLLIIAVVGYGACEFSQGDILCFGYPYSTAIHYILLNFLYIYVLMIFASVSDVATLNRTHKLKYPKR